MTAPPVNVGVPPGGASPSAAALRSADQVTFQVRELAVLLGIDAVRLGWLFGRLERVGRLHIHIDASTLHVRVADRAVPGSLLEALQRLERP